MALVIWIVVIVGLFFSVVVFVGAPYLPTLSPQIVTAFELLDLHRGQTILELGCGDGKVLLAAAQRGHKAVGIELNPLLAAIAWVRTRRYRSHVRVIWGNYWLRQWPPSDGVYVFLIDRFMPKLDGRMQQYGGKLISVAFRVPGREPSREGHGVYLYDYGKGLALGSESKVP